MTTLADVVNNLSEFSERDTIYAAKPWSEHSTALVASEPRSGGLPDKAAALGLQYFLEVSIARDFLEDWLRTLTSETNLRTKVERLIQYAIRDA